MPLMATAAGTMVFRALHRQRRIASGFDMAFYRLIEARPSGAAVKFGLGGKKLKAASGADEHPFTLFMMSGLEKGRSVPSSRRTWYCSSVSIFFHSSLLRVIFAMAVAAASALAKRNAWPSAVCQCLRMANLLNSRLFI